MPCYEPCEGSDLWEFFNLDPDHTASSVHDDISTTLGSELGVPALTVGPTLTPSTRSQTSPSGDRPEDLDFHYELDLPGLNEDQEGLGFPTLDKSPYFRHMGEAPAILVQGPLSPQSKRLCLDTDFAIGQSPKSPLLQAGSPSQSTVTPIKRGRSNPLPKQTRAKAASMRKIKACYWCHIHKVSCSEVTPCERCVKRFPHYPKACDRARRLSEVRFPDHYKSTSIWLDNWQVVAYQRTAAATTFDQALEASPDMALTFPNYVANPIQLPSQPQGFNFPPLARYGVSPMSTFTNWPETFNNPWVPQSLVPGLNEPGPAASELPILAETQLSIELEQYKRTRFSAAVGALLLAYRDSPLVALEPGPANAKKQQASAVNTMALVHKVVEMQCWLRIWRRPALYSRVQGIQAVGMSNDTAITALVACEKKILGDLDELDTKLNREDELPVWACIWQMLLTYRELIGMYSGVDHGPWSIANLGLNTGLESVPAALSTVEHLHRLLVIKHAAYISSSSPVFRKDGQEETGKLLAGNERLRSEWENVLLQREEFYRVFSDEAPADAFLKVGIIDDEAKVERRRKRSRK
ncbi:hypothetical protein VMCG_01254 [Cytospora schulzeri]|uniref:Zn(2)-C6 fungal-type domain-containing protein n=1 Tax=Cytospora schulzeri TaxID=448051 RepID=A0A423X6G8_9PEZI|nr:hypothetical protein VMCG_01254 [Valsa malicola]